MFTVQTWILMSPGPHKKPPFDITTRFETKRVFTVHFQGKCKRRKVFMQKKKRFKFQREYFNCCFVLGGVQK